MRDHRQAGEISDATDVEGLSGNLGATVAAESEQKLLDEYGNVVTDDEGQAS